ncbi:hypothetical protein GS501_03155 [Saccharibacter sp. 17.LH.SD]|uniref:hypothetical protein n=1 Tax=Saccharibacter sp. 17.LH.SD TaxID=2689393 RepID=UPI001368ED87|nr:hypothetical protein [Saccharibacter sp. 17.LH.SD]MXV44052.1 hypothetical protein [Saccharibacter sp. 17.LH.SD]
MPSTSFVFRFKSVALMGAACALLGTTMPAVAQSVRFGQAYQGDTNDNPAPQYKAKRRDGEHFHAQGHRSPPPGYQDAPSPDFQNGPDPDHQAMVKSHRDSVTGSNLGAFGTAYQDSNPVRTGQLGDATGNGWVSPRGNGW